MDVSFAKKARIVGTSTVFFCLSLFLTAYSSRNPELARVGTTIIHQLLFPFQQAAHGLTEGMGSVWSRYFWLVNVEEKNVRLNELVQRLRAENAQLREYQFENSELRQALHIQETKKLSVMVADVIGFDSSSWNRVVTVNLGQNSGVKIGQAVIRKEGIVGQVIATGSHSSRVLLITDHSSGVDSIVQRSRTRGILSGRSAKQCSLEYVTKEEDVQAGDRVITSGMDGVFPKGLVVGRVTEVNPNVRDLFQRILIEPVVDFNHLEKVSIVIGESEVDRDAGPVGGEK